LPTGQCREPQTFNGVQKRSRFAVVGREGKCGELHYVGGLANYVLREKCLGGGGKGQITAAEKNNNVPSPWGNTHTWVEKKNEGIGGRVSPLWGKNPTSARIQIALTRGEGMSGEEEEKQGSSVRAGRAAIRTVVAYLGRDRSPCMETATVKRTLQLKKVVD